MATPRYSMLPRASTPSTTENESLLPTHSFFTTGHLNQTYGITISPSTALRILSSIFCLTSVIILITRGHHFFIATDIFLILMMIQNALQFLKTIFTTTFRVSVEYRGREHDLGSLKKKVSLLIWLDIIWTLAAFLSLAIESAVYFSDRWNYGGDVIGGVTVGYIAMLFHAPVVIPALDKHTITLTAKLNSAKDNRHASPDLKPSVPATPGEEQESGVVTDEASTRSGINLV
ncbi:hypothetical protein BP6252_00805 [Coleophoma cylindrospora]|uniref:Uncharacterized protein n=1 Tax=Coleophoma cylindrospora TaxID=1849047 RepID=A0A3D8SR33_9HELO|nr:hypothetical protein BP6252_00805 [Coleophoma cylindrospora]